MSNSAGPVPGVYTVPQITQPSKTLVVDLSCFIASAMKTRNVLRVRATAQNDGQLSQISYTLKQTNAPAAPTQATIPAPAGNVATVLSSNTPVHLIVTTPNGTLDMGQNTLFVITSPIVSIKAINDQNIADADLNCIII